MRRRDILILGLSSASIVSLNTCSAFAQGRYPEQPIRLVVPRSAGGVVDVVARLWADRVRSQLGTIVIENQGGGGGTIAAATVARARTATRSLPAPPASSSSIR
jgi:tripartite-type tricarboxylate transporter receptor subunit TctC